MLNDKNTSMFIRQRAKEIIDSKYKREWVAERLGISTTYLGHVLTGVSNPSLPLIKLMALVVEVKESEIFDTIPNPKKVL